MRKLVSVTLAAVLSIAFAGIASAAEPAAKPAARAAAKAAAPAAAGVKAGDTVFICGCGPGCKCNTIQATPGKCGCGRDLTKASVTKIEGDRIVVQAAGAKAERVFKAPYKCSCGPGCKCNTVALGPGKCGCGSDFVKNE